MKKTAYFSFLLIFLSALIFSYFTFSVPSPYPYKLAICALFKNEASWLKEWIEYHHKVLKVDHFYLYNNDSTDHYLEVLQPYIDAQVVELIDWSSSHKENGIWGIEDIAFIPYQLGSYNDCLKRRALGKAQWVAIIDIDEFIVPVQGTSSFHSFLDEAAKKKIGSVLLLWRVFGTSFVHALSSQELLLEKLTWRASDVHAWNKHTKSIHRPEAVAFSLVHESKQLHPGYKRKCLSSDLCRVHHYWTRTEKYLDEKRNLGAQEREHVIQAFNHCEDKTALQYVALLRKHVFFEKK